MVIIIRNSPCYIVPNNFPEVICAICSTTSIYVTASTISPPLHRYQSVFFNLLSVKQLHLVTLISILPFPFVSFIGKNWHWQKQDGLYKNNICIPWLVQEEGLSAEKPREYGTNHLGAHCLTTCKFIVVCSAGTVSVNCIIKLCANKTELQMLP